jgi:hypothetical protein
MTSDAGTAPLPGASSGLPGGWLEVQKSWQFPLGHGRACPGHPDNQALRHPDRDRRDKPGDDAASFVPVTEGGWRYLNLCAFLGVFRFAWMPVRGGARLRPNVTFLQHLSEISRLQGQKAHSSIAVREKLYIDFINRVGSHLYQSPPRNLPWGACGRENAGGLARNSPSLTIT